MPSFFGDLPLKLRIQIYRELLVSDESVDVIKYPGPRSNKPHRRTNLHPAILRSCRQAYAEALGYLYEENRIRFDFFDFLYYYRGKHQNLWFGLSEANLMRIKHVSRFLPSNVSL